MSLHGVVQELLTYPLRSCQAQTVKELKFGAEGLEGWQWLFVDEAGQTITRNTAPKLSTVQVLVNEQGLNLGLGKQFFVVPMANSFKRVIRIQVAGGEEADAALEADLFSQALSQYLEVNGRLVRYAPAARDSGILIGPEGAADGAESFRAQIRLSGVAVPTGVESKIRIGDLVFSQVFLQSKNPNIELLWWPQSGGRIVLGDSIEVLT